MRWWKQILRHFSDMPAPLAWSFAVQVAVTVAVPLGFVFLASVESVSALLWATMGLLVLDGVLGAVTCHLWRSRWFARQQRDIAMEQRNQIMALLESDVGAQVQAAFDAFVKREGFAEPDAPPNPVRWKQ